MPYIVMFNHDCAGVTDECVLGDNPTSKEIAEFTDAYVQKIMTGMGFADSKEYLSLLPGHSSNEKIRSGTVNIGDGNHLYSFVGLNGGDAYNWVEFFFQKVNSIGSSLVKDWDFIYRSLWDKEISDYNLLYILQPHMKSICPKYAYNDGKLNVHRYPRLWYCCDWKEYADDDMAFFRNDEDDSETTKYSWLLSKLKDGLLSLLSCN